MNDRFLPLFLKHFQKDKTKRNHLAMANENKYSTLTVVSTQLCADPDYHYSAISLFICNFNLAPDRTVISEDFGGVLKEFRDGGQERKVSRCAAGH